MTEINARHRARERGFTLLELTVAGMVLVIASVSLAASMAQSSGLTQAPREEMNAHHAIRAAIAGLAATPFDQVAASYHGQSFDVPGLTPRPDDPDGMCGEVSFEYGPGNDTSFYMVTIRVAWRGRAGDRAIESVHYLSNVRGDTGTPTPLEDLDTEEVQS